METVSLAPAVPEPFIGRDEHLKWLARILFSQQHWHLPFVITGPSACGKTSLVARFLQLHNAEVQGYWPRIGRVTQVDDFLLRMGVDGSRKDQGKAIIVILDDVGYLADNVIHDICRTIQNNKMIRAVIITTDRNVSIDQAPTLTMNGIGRYDVESLLRSTQLDVPSRIIDELVVRIGGYATNMQVLARAVMSGGIEGLAGFLKLPLYSVTDDIPKGKILTLAKPALIYVTSQLIEGLQRHPEGMYDLSPRRFEELLADLLADQGMEVQLTQETRDGGRDIIAEYDTPAGRILCLVDAKRYRRDRKIGVGLVRQLHGTLCDHRATTAMMITTSTYSSDAHAYQQRHKWQLNLRDYNHIMELLGKFKSSS